MEVQGEYASQHVERPGSTAIFERATDLDALLDMCPGPLALPREQRGEGQEGERDRSLVSPAELYAQVDALLEHRHGGRQVTARTNLQTELVQAVGLLLLVSKLA